MQRVVPSAGGEEAQSQPYTEDVLAALLLGAAATLVVPYFEVSIEPENRNFDTRFTITNTSGEPQRARINVWTDLGHPVLYYTTLLDAHGSKTISMRDLVVDGIIDICASPGQRVPIQLQEAVRCQLTSGCKLDLNPWKLDCGTHVGKRHAHAIGYVTVDVIADCMDLTAPNIPEYAAQMRAKHVLTGTFEQIGNGVVLAKGSLIDRAGGPVPPFFKPPFPRDPLARRPPRICPPLSQPAHF